MRFQRLLVSLFVAIAVVAAPSAVAASDGNASTSDASALFRESIRPMLQDRCASCHSRVGGKTKGGLSVDSLADLLAGGEGGPAIVRGHPEQSLLLRAI